jgi:chemotaxis protein methyltransferase CheR
MQSDALGLSSRALPLMRDLIHERLGLFYESDRFDILADRLSPLVVERGFESFLDYYYLLKYDEAAPDEWRRVMDALSVAETFFWREIDQLQAIVNQIVPSLVRAHPGVPVRIWSVPCATGEEPLTLAMLLDTQGWFERALIEIHASDASPAALARAKAGRYRGRAFRSLPPDVRERYFRPAGAEEWTVSPALVERVCSWTVANLMCESDIALRARVPIILCRNVFIYFSQAAVERTVQAFARATPDPAYLCLGAAESLLKFNTPFTLEQIDGAFVYVKRTERK